MRLSNRRIRLTGLIEAAAVLTILFSAVTALGLPHPNIDLFAHFRLQYLVSSILLLLILVIQKRWRYVAGLVPIVILNVATVLPWYLGSDDQNRSKDDSTIIKVLHANVHSSNTHHERLIELLHNEEPDVVFLQEVTDAWISAMDALPANYSHRYSEPRNGNFGIAVFSRIPFQSVRHIDSPPLDYPTIVVELEIGQQRLTAISTHPTIPLGARLHAARGEQLASVSTLLQGIDGHVLLIGDFNDSLWGAELKRLQRDTGLGNVRQGFGILPTWPTFMPFAMIPIDHALVSEQIDVIDVRTGARIGSDHLPLIVTLSL